MGILLVYDVTDENSFLNVKNWMRQIEQHAAANVNKVLVANKCDVSASERVRILTENVDKFYDDICVFCSK